MAICLEAERGFQLHISKRKKKINKEQNVLEGVTRTHHHLMAFKSFFDSICSRLKFCLGHFLNFLNWLTTLSRKLQGSKSVRPDSFILPWGKDPDLDYPPPTLQNARSLTREASAIDNQCQCSFLRPTSSLDNDIDPPRFSFNRTPHLEPLVRQY
jgi:hypothetical protein